MLFNSAVFLIFFLPVVLVGFYTLRAYAGLRFAIGGLVLASLFFYGYWNPVNLVLICFSISTNYLLARRIAKPLEPHEPQALLVFGIVFNLTLIAYFKYANFLGASLNAVPGITIPHLDIILPLAISFFTFQQIAYLWDVKRTGECETDLVRYALFVSFFPQLIAGPIVHHREMLPQFRESAQKAVDWNGIAAGATLFLVGIFKKVVLADHAAVYANTMFNGVADGAAPEMAAAWLGALAYTFQIYFDFAGYSDMALGLGLLFGIRLPVNFFSPYKAGSIIEFWRRWHMTLSRFLRDYLYIPLGGNRRGLRMRHVNLLLTMLIGGLWHGASWTFVIWGGLHGSYLILNHGWNTMRGKKRAATAFGRCAGTALTFVAVMIAWVVFRTESVAASAAVYKSMLGLNGLGMDGVSPRAVALMVVLGLITFGLPNSIQYMRQWVAGGTLAADGQPALPVWKPNWMHATGLAAVIALSLHFGALESPFLYFQF